ncbi:hypothetical protein QVD17_15514 [Tagetes erecta]|uniref:Uncharacterized protein n=1 Tax=Tagetes erecta TaxID=13708 RepID=A0AAD8KQ92_TARER|nr:hypothetical protein QVD17_15514 [Tagetes erecta]
MGDKDMSSKGFEDVLKVFDEVHTGERSEEVEAVRNEKKDSVTEFDASFLERNKTLLRTLRLQQEHEDSLKELRTQLFGTPESLADKSGGYDPMKLQTMYGKSVLYDVLQEGQGSKRKERDWQDRSNNKKDNDEELSDLTKPYRPSSLLGVSKFSRRIVEAEIPGKLKMSSGIRRYNGLDDPDQHLFEFFWSGSDTGLDDASVV